MIKKAEFCKKVIPDKQIAMANEVGIEHRKGIPSPFEINDSSVEKIDNWLLNEGVTIESLRAELEKTGKRSGLILEVSEYYKSIIVDTQKQIEEQVHDRYHLQKWEQVLESIKTVVDLLGYLTLLQMDAKATIISMLEAKCDTERIVLSKHAYTLIYEVQNNDFHNVVSKKIDQLPDVLLEMKEKRSIMKEFNNLVKKMVSKGEAKKIRDKSDAHKDTFTLQMEAYTKCNYGVGVASLYFFDKIVSLLQKAVELMLAKVPLLYEQYRAGIIERLCKTERLLERMKEYEGKSLPEGGLTGD